MSNTSAKLLRSLSFGAQEPANPNLSVKEIVDIRHDTEVAFSALEGRTNMPRITKISGTVGAAGGSASLDITGVSFLAGRTQASLAIGSGNGLVTVTACRPGESGNDITVTFVDPAANSQSLSTTVSGSNITVHLATSNVGAITSTATLVTASINSTTASKKLIHAVAGGTGGSVVTAHSSANLAGGTGAGLIVYVGGSAVDVDTVVTNTAISVIDGAATGFTEGDVAAVEVKSHTLLTAGVPVIVGA